MNNNNNDKVYNNNCEPSSKRSADEHGSSPTPQKRLNNNEGATSTLRCSLLDEYASTVIDLMTAIRDARLRSSLHFEMYRASRCSLNGFLEKIHSILNIVVDPGAVDKSDGNEMDFLKSIQELESSDEQFMSRLPWRLQRLRSLLNGVDLPFLHMELNDIVPMCTRMTDMVADIKRMEQGSPPLRVDTPAQRMPRVARTG